MFLPQALFTAPLHEVCPLTPEEANIPRQIISSYSKGNSKKHWQNYYFCLSKRSLLLNPSNLVNKNMGECQLRKKKIKQRKRKYLSELYSGVHSKSEHAYNVPAAQDVLSALVMADRWDSALALSHTAGAPMRCTVGRRFHCIRGNSVLWRFQGTSYPAFLDLFRN